MSEGSAAAQQHCTFFLLHTATLSMYICHWSTNHHQSSWDPPSIQLHTLSVCPSSCSPSQARAASAPSWVLKVMKAMPLLGCVCMYRQQQWLCQHDATAAAAAGAEPSCLLVAHTRIPPVCRLHLPFHHHHLRVQPPPMLLAAPNSSRAPPLLCHPPSLSLSLSTH